MHYEILDDRRRTLLPQFASFKGNFYLAGGTALALQIDHRDSIDFDFFSRKGFDTARLFKECEASFGGHSLTKTQDEKDSLSFLIDTAVSVSFLGFPYPLVKPLVVTEYFDIASIEDIGCMKLSAITGRAALKDYVDLYFILRSIPLSVLLESTATKFPSLDRNLILKSLVYFDDVAREPIRFVGQEVPLEELKAFFEKAVRETILE